MRIRRWSWMKVIPVAAALTAASAWATSVRLVNLAEMTEAADRVFRGRCLSVKEIGDSPAGLPAVEFRFEVLDGVKGVEKGQIVVFRQIKTSLGRRPGIPGIPSYRKGDDMLLFLAGDSRIGLTSPIGLGQGAFRVTGEPNGEARAVNELDNRNLMRGVEAAEASSMGLSAAQFGTLREGGPIAVKTLVEATRRIDQHRIQSGRVQ